MSILPLVQQDEPIVPVTEARCLAVEILIGVHELLGFFDTKSLQNFVVLNRRIAKDVANKGVEIGFWQALCHSFCVENGLYAIPEVLFSGSVDRRFFFDTLFPARMKWSTSEVSHAFKIEVACRFRPGERVSKNLVVPLHQFLKVRRKKQHQQQEGEKEFAVGFEDPEEFLDPFLRTLMRDPVRLTSSGRILDRSVAVQCILRGGRDPFNGTRIGNECLVPVPELAIRIHNWKIKKNEMDISLETSEVKTLIDDITVDPDLVNALMEAEQIGFIASRALQDSVEEIKAANGPNPGMYAPLNYLAAPDAPIGNNVIGPEVDFYDEIGAEAGALASEDTRSPDFNVRGEENIISEVVDSKKWKADNNARVLDMNKKTATVSLNVPGSGVRPFYFAEVLTPEDSQATVYQGGPRSLVSSFLNGYNTCILVYGQTGSGKTHTMFGPADQSAEITLNCSSGIVPRVCAELLQGKSWFSQVGISVSFTAQFVEIYNETVTCLLTGANATVRRDNGDVVGAVEQSFETVEDIYSILTTGHQRKRFAATALNERSSRSHTILIIQATQTVPEKDLIIKSQMHLVDLAGSERVKKSNVKGSHLKEAVGINSSLLVLGKVISALVECKSHVPYLESKLTTLLRGAFGGNSRTLAMVNCRSDDEHGDETLQTLRFGERCALISNSIRSVASSAADALSVLEDTLLRVGEQIKSLEAKGKVDMPSYQKLRFSFQQLQRKKVELVPKLVETAKAI